MSDKPRKIGMKHESSLHKALKFRYAGFGATEEEREGYVCDAVGPDGEIIEIQTGHFGAIKTKITALAAKGRVRLIYPVIVTKTIELYDEDGNLVCRKPSPRKGTAWDIFRELVRAPVLVNLRRLTIELAIIDAVERRRDDGKGSRHRKGASIEDRFLETWRESIVLKKKADWRRFLPLKGEWTARNLAKEAKIRLSLAQKAMYVLEKTGFAEKAGKKGNSFVYRAVHARRAN